MMTRHFNAWLENQHVKGEFSKKKPWCAKHKSLRLIRTNLSEKFLKPTVAAQATNLRTKSPNSLNSTCKIKSPFKNNKSHQKPGSKCPKKKHRDSVKSRSLDPIRLWLVKRQLLLGRVRPRTYSIGHLEKQRELKQLAHMSGQNPYKKRSKKLQSPHPTHWRASEVGLSLLRVLKILRC